VDSLWGAVALICLATASHQAWSANVYTLASDMFPRGAVASIIGLSGFGGAIGGLLIAKLAGYVLQFTHSYLPLFILAGSAYRGISAAASARSANGAGGEAGLGCLWPAVRPSKGLR
jgi:nitrate/nitrite transporter NarK